MEERECNECGEVWNDTGDEKCPFCHSTNTQIVNDEDDSDD